MPPLINIKICNTILYCRRWAETVAFYRERLGLPVTYDAGWFVEFALTGDSRLSIADESRATVKSSRGSGLTLTWQVADIEETRQTLCVNGIEAGPIKTHPWGGRVFYFFDPEGHRLEVWA